MAREYQFSVTPHPVIYDFADEKTRGDINIYFSEPDQGVNEDTGLLLLICGFGANANSHVYKKMRSEFADKYNLLTVQCDYFGQEFMGASQKVSVDDVHPTLSEEENSLVFRNKQVDFEKLIEILDGKKNSAIIVREELTETLSNFNDMGIMQALDNLTALLQVIEIVKDNGYRFNAKKIIAYGHSHGSYLAYLCNAFCPALFSLLIDNSSWLFPQYLKKMRYLASEISNVKIGISFNYLAAQLPYDKEILNLNLLYQAFRNKCKIVSYHGTTDSLISTELKRRFCNAIELCDYNEISAEQVDGSIFKSTDHGLDANFLELFALVMNNHEFGHDQEILLPTTYLETKYSKYTIDYRLGVPVLSMDKKDRTSTDRYSRRS